uniref:Predicted protein n=1 Tax=Physcomitrium patens TaxID=3218 RepID=A9U5E3_PHYPA
MTPELVERLNVVPITGISILFQAVLFSVPFQGTLFLKKEPFKRQKMEEKALTAEPILDPRRKIEEIQRLGFKRGGELSQWIQGREYKAVSEISKLGCSRFSVTSRDLLVGAKRILARSLGRIFGEGSSKGQGMYMDPSIASMFQAFSLSMQQQQSNDRKEALATKALQAMVIKIDQFDGRNISRYLRCYVREMELNQVSEKKMVELFGLAMISEIRDHITSIMDHYRNSWEVFSHALKDEYFLEDVDHVEKLTLEPNKVDLFLQAADVELQGKLELLLEDKEEDEGLTTKWKNVEDAVGLLTKRERRNDRSNIPKTVQAPKAPICTTPPTMPTVQPSTSLSKKADMEMEEIIRGMRDLQIKLARLEENTSTNNLKNVSKQGYVQRCIWCNDASHTRKDCNEFNNMIRQGIIC